MADDAFARLIRSAGVTETNLGGNPDFIGSVNGRVPYPLETWAPEHCGQLDMAIDRDGRWFHEGSEIKRSELVSLFAGLLRKESDGAQVSKRAQESLLRAREQEKLIQVL